MSGTSRISTRVSIRLPNLVVQTLERRVSKEGSRWGSVGEYLKERVIYDVMRSHKRVEANEGKEHGKVKNRMA